MTLDTLQSLLFWSAALNYGVLLLWFGLFSLAPAWLFRLHGRWFQLDRPGFDRVHYLCMAIYKLLIMVFNLGPALAISLMR